MAQGTVHRLLQLEPAAGVPGSVRPCHGNLGEEKMDVDDEHHQKRFDTDQLVVSTALSDPDLPDVPQHLNLPFNSHLRSSLMCSRS